MWSSWKSLKFPGVPMGSYIIRVSPLSTVKCGLYVSGYGDKGHALHCY